MKGTVLASLLFALSIPSSAQNHFSLGIGFGPSYFFNDKSLQRQIDNTRCFILGYYLFKKSFAFNPALSILRNDYHSRSAKTYNVFHVRQYCIAADVDVLMQLSRRSYIRVGLWGNYLGSSNVNITYNRNAPGGYLNYGTHELDDGYDPSLLQTGFSMGLAFKVFKREHIISVKFIQFASRVVDNNFVTSHLVYGQNITVLTIKARPTMLRLSFEINLKKREMKKAKEE